MHICEDHFIPEIIDPDTLEVLPAGQQGELVFTCITKEAFPLIRYRTRDIDDMLIIRGVNVFPSQIESALLSVDNKATNYFLVVDRVNNLDTLEVQIELRDDMFGDNVRDVESYKSRLKHAIDSAIGVGVNIRLLEPKSLARSMGKATRVQDNRTIKNKFEKK